MTDKDKQTKPQTIFVLVKPDGFAHAEAIKSLIIDKLIKTGTVSCVFQQDIVMLSENVERHYSKDDVWKKKYGRKICAMRLIVGEKDVGDYDALLYGNTILPSITKYMGNKKMQIMLFQVVGGGEECFTAARDLLGNIDPSKAGSDTIRGTFSSDSFEAAWTDKTGPRAVRNVCHISENTGESYHEARAMLGCRIDGFYT